MIKEKDIVAEAGNYWILRQRSAYYVMRNEITHAVSDSAYPLDDDGLSLATARMQYLAKRHGKSK